MNHIDQTIVKKAVRIAWNFWHQIHRLSGIKMDLLEVAKAAIAKLSPVERERVDITSVLLDMEATRNRNFIANHNEKKQDKLPLPLTPGVHRLNRSDLELPLT